MIRADQNAREIRNHESHPSDRAADGDLRRDGEAGGCQQDQPVATGIDPECARVFIAQRQHVHAPAHAQHDRAGGKGAGADEEQAGPVGRGEAAQQPEHDAGQPGLGVRNEGDESDQRAAKRADHDAGQYQGQDRRQAVGPVDGEHGQQRRGGAYEGSKLYPQSKTEEQDSDDAAQCRA